MAKGKKTGGRKQGSKNKRTARLDARAADGVSPLDYMLTTMRDKKSPMMLRADMAKAAAPYLHARRATAVELTGKQGGAIEHKTELWFDSEGYKAAFAEFFSSVMEVHGSGNGASGSDKADGHVRGAHHGNGSR